ncbi:MAG: amidohydrolase [Planctomycetota bacterium]|nr:amidohydrolase [Planctomycetota bacterium]
MLIDAHAHFFSRRFYEFHAEAAKVSLDEVQAATGAEIPADPVDLAGRWKVECARKNVDRMVLIASIPGDEDGVAVALKEYPETFIGYFMLNPLAPDARERLARAAGELGLRGVCLFPALHHFDPGDERLFPLYEDAQKLGVVVFVHFGLLKVPIREKLKLAPVSDLRYSNPVLLARAANRFPELPFVIPHFGGGYFHETLLLGAQCRNVCVDTSSSNGWIGLVPELTLQAVFEKALLAFGPYRVLFGTDSSAFPRGWRGDLYQEQRRILNALNVAPSVQDNIFGKNLERLLAR